MLTKENLVGIVSFKRGSWMEFELKLL